MLRKVILLLLSFFLILGGIYVFPWDRVNWGRISLLPAATITVTGEAKGEQANQLATFQASVTAANADKQKATDEVNTKMTALTAALKTFGIPAADIKTEAIVVSEEPEVQTMIYPPVPTSGKKVWRATNSITITLRDVNKASALSDILNKSGATNMYGPNFTTDNTTATQADTLVAAITDARTKAERIANASGRSLGKVINVVEGGINYPVPYLMEARGIADTKSVPTPVEPGSQTIYKTVTVIFELK